MEFILLKFLIPTTQKHSDLSTNKKSFYWNSND